MEPVKLTEDIHLYENFISEDEFQIRARARGVEVGANDATTGVGAYLRALAHQLSAQSVVEVVTGAIVVRYCN
jgi:hypothetical protein